MPTKVEDVLENIFMHSEESVTDFDTSVFENQNDPQKFTQAELNEASNFAKK